MIVDHGIFQLLIYQYFELNYPKFYKMDNLSKLGWLASEVLLKDTAIKSYEPQDVGLILSNPRRLAIAKQWRIAWHGIGVLHRRMEANGWHCQESCQFPSTSGSSQSLDLSSTCAWLTTLFNLNSHIP